MPPPLSPVAEAAPPAEQPAAAPAPAQRPRTMGGLFIYGLLLILTLTVGYESYYILMHDEAAVVENKKRPPIVVAAPPGATAAPSRPIDVPPVASPSEDAVAVYLQSLNLAVATGSDPRIFANGQVFHIGQIINPENGLRWTSVNDQTRVLEFTDQFGHRYLKKF